jgi:RNA polymerase sigma-70 factor (ECF subfamily)
VEQSSQASSLSPERQFDGQWAEAVLRQARARLREECAAAGKLALYETLDLLSDNHEKTLTYADLAARLAMSVSALKTAISRLRDRYGELVRDEVAKTVADPAELEAEISYLRSIVTA